MTCLGCALVLLISGRSALGQTPSAVQQSSDPWPQARDARSIVHRLPPLGVETNGPRLDASVSPGGQVLPASFQEDLDEFGHAPSLLEAPQPPSGLADSAEIPPDAWDAEGVSRVLEGGAKVGTDFHAPSSDFAEGIVVRGSGVAMKIGGYVKVDLIQDFDPIDSTDVFDTTEIHANAAVDLALKE